MKLVHCSVLTYHHVLSFDYLSCISKIYPPPCFHIVFIQREKNKQNYERFTEEGKQNCDPTKWNSKEKILLFKESNLADSSRTVCNSVIVHAERKYDTLINKTIMS